MRVLVQGSVFVFWVGISQRGALEQLFFLSPRESCLLFLLLKVSCSWTVCLLARVPGWNDWDFLFLSEFLCAIVEGSSVRAKVRSILV